MKYHENAWSDIRSRTHDPRHRLRCKSPPWPDPVIDRLGLDPRSAYVETYWLGTLGPSTTWLLRRLAHGLESDARRLRARPAEPAPASSASATKAAGTRRSPDRSAGSCSSRSRAGNRADRTLEVRRRVPPLNRRQVMHLPDELRNRHDHWQARQLDAPPAEGVRRRCRKLALALIAHRRGTRKRRATAARWGYHPALCYESTAWAADQSSELVELDRQAERRRSGYAGLLARGGARSCCHPVVDVLDTRATAVVVVVPEPPTTPGSRPRARHRSKPAS